MSRGDLRMRHPAIGEPFDFRIEDDGERVAVHVGDETVELEISRRDSTEGWCRYQSKVIPFAAAWAGSDLHLWLDGQQFIFERVERQRRDRRAAISGDIPSAGRRPADASDPKRVVAPMAGRVLAVNVKPGDSVSAGDEVCVLEAMKMEHSIRASVDGVVKAVYIEQGQQVMSGNVLVELE